MLHLLFAAGFLGCALVQWNDPDPVPWIVVYGLAALSSARAARGVPMRWLSAALAVGAAAWAGALVASSTGPLLVAEHFTRWEMRGGPAEEAREIGGLLLVFVGAAAVVVSSAPVGSARASR